MSLRTYLVGLIAAATLSVGLLPGTAAAQPPDPAAGAVFVGTNHNNNTDPREPANQVAYYRRAADGTLTLVGRFDTGGQGSGPSQRFAGDGLGAGNSVVLTGDGRFLLVANAGSNNVSVLRVLGDRLEVTDVESTGDGSPSHRFPNSVAVHGNAVYALNGADHGSITGFTLDGDGKLSPIPDSTRELGANERRFSPDPLSNPTQVSFTPDGSQLVVSLKDGPAAGFVPDFTPNGPGRVMVFGMDGQRPAAKPVQTDFANRGPFGFSFDPRGNLILAQFVGGGVEDGELTGAVGSYRINRDGTLTALSEAVPDQQIDTCWAVNNGRYAFGSNYTSGTISSFRIGADGQLSLLKSVAATTDPTGTAQGATPLDLGISPDGRFLYLVQPGSGKVGGWQIGDDGALTKLGEFGGLPKTVDGDHGPVDFGAGGSPAGIAVR